jgi:hypothetical protein
MSRLLVEQLTRLRIWGVMIAPPVEPLEPEIWFEQIRTLATRLSRLGGDSPEAVIRKAYYLVQLTPTPLRHVVRCQTDEAVFEQMLDSGAYDAAVTALIGSPVGFEISRDAGRAGISASVRLPDDAGVGAARDQTVARALLAAWSRCLEGLRTRATSDLNLGRDPHIGRSAPPPRSSRH